MTDGKEKRKRCETTRLIHAPWMRSKRKKKFLTVNQNRVCHLLTKAAGAKAIPILMELSDREVLSAEGAAFNSHGRRAVD